MSALFRDPRLRRDLPFLKAGFIISGNVYWTGSFKQGFTDQLNQAQTYQESSINRIANKIAKSQYAADTSSEFLSCKTLGDLKKMAEAIANP